MSQYSLDRVTTALRSSGYGDDDIVDAEFEDVNSLCQEVYRIRFLHPDGGDEQTDTGTVFVWDNGRRADF